MGEKYNRPTPATFIMRSFKKGGVSNKLKIDGIERKMPYCFTSDNGSDLHNMYINSLRVLYNSILPMT